MVKHHARKNEARGRRSATGETHRQAVDAVRRDQAEDVVRLKTPADGRTGWTCDTGASLIIEAMTPGPGRLGTLHAVIYVCPEHQAAAEARITAAGYDAEVREAPPGHRWDPWPCGHTTAFKSKALPALTGTSDDGLVLVVDYVPPALDGAEPCPECGGKGVSGQWFEQPSDGGRPPLAVASACTACMGCGRAEHDGCAPGVHVDEDEDDVEELLDDELDEDQDQGEPCLSCGGREFYGLPVEPSPADQVDDRALEELLARARARGVRAWDVMSAEAWGNLDELLGEGAQALAEAAQRATVYLIAPCGCTEGRVRTVRRDELGGAA